MESNAATPEDIHAFTVDYIHACSPQGHPFNLPKEYQDRMAYILGAALDAIREEARLASRWSQAQLYGSKDHLAHFVDAEMNKTGARCSLTFYAGSVSMEFSLPYINELPSMDSGFWSDLAGIITRQKLTYVTHEIHEAASKSEANKSISRFTKAPLFEFLTQFHIAYQDDPEGEIRLGDFEKSIFYLDSSWAEIIATLTGIFRDFSRLSQCLYRSFYIKASQDPKRRRRLADFNIVRDVLEWISSQTETWTPAEVAAAFPQATKIDIQVAHDIAMEMDIISGIGKPFRIFTPTGPRE